MTSRSRRAVVVGFAALMAWALVAQPAPAAEGTTYNFDACEQGWVASKATDPQGTWRRMERAGEGQTWAMAYPLYGPDSTANMTSAAHTSTGKPVTIKYAARWNIEHPETSEVDYLKIEWGTDPKGRVWKSLKVHATVVNPAFPNFDQASVTFTPPPGKFHIRFTMISDALIFGLGPQIDNVKVDTPAPAGTTCKG